MEEARNVWYAAYSGAEDKNATVQDIDDQNPDINSD
jgi:hypothetical protein